MLAAILEKEGIPKEQIASKLAEITPYSPGYINKLMPKKYKMIQKTAKSLDYNQQLSSPRRASEIRKFTPENEQKASGESATPVAGELITKTSACTAAQKRPRGNREPAKKPKKPVTCPHCHVELTKVLCGSCWREISLKDLRRLLCDEHA